MIQKLSQSWQESNLIRDFISALRAATVMADLPEEERRELQGMIEWASTHAESVDPLAHLNEKAEQFKDKQCR